MQPITSPAGADELHDGLVYGTQNGYLVCWKLSKGKPSSHEAFEEVHSVLVANPGEITRLTYEASLNHLIMCNQNSVVQMYTIETKMTPHIIFSVTMNGEDHDILIFGLYDGQIGNAAVNSKQGVFCIDNPMQGTALYRLNPQAHICTYPVTIM
ncbi:hypothetical protein L208DRAFT_1422233 [Tricholoma matsutake]|nr:hypothetical protein L208DRAFT_1422233 [Tricholoma matsutake 945]